MQELIQFLQGPSGRNRSSSVLGSSYSEIPFRNQVLYAVASNLGGILLVYENRRMVRKTNVLAERHDQVAVMRPLRVINEMLDQSEVVKVTVNLEPGTTVMMMYCHRLSEQIKWPCKKVYLCGKVNLCARASFNHETESWQYEHAQRCRRLCPECVPPELFLLEDGEEITLKSGLSYQVRVSGSQHVLYLNNNPFSFSLTGDDRKQALKSYVDSHAN